VSSDGPVSCVHVTGGDGESLCLGCGANNQGAGLCENTCRERPACLDQSRATFAGVGDEACGQFTGDPGACGGAWHVTGQGDTATCFFDTDGHTANQCVSCAPFIEVRGECSNTCQEPPACVDATRTVFAGGPFTEACRQFEDDGEACENAWALSSAGAVSCFYDVDDEGGGLCLGCGPSNQAAERCENTCRPRPLCDDAGRTVFVGAGGCAQFDEDAASCGRAWHVDASGSATTCYLSVDCLGCDLESEAGESCSNACSPGGAVVEPQSKVNQ